MQSCADIPGKRTSLTGMNQPVMHCGIELQTVNSYIYTLNAVCAQVLHRVNTLIGEVI